MTRVTNDGVLGIMERVTAPERSQVNPWIVKLHTL